MHAGSQRVFVLEDQPEIGHMVCRVLEDQGFKTEYFARARQFLHRIKIQRPHLCIIDLGLPDDDGLNIVRALQARNDIAVIIVTGRGAPIDRILGLALGADDYVVKPFEPRELVARVKAVLRRSERRDGHDGETVMAVAHFAGWTFDFDSHTLMAADGAVFELSSAEAQILLAFCRAPNRILSRETLLGLRGGDDRLPFDRSIDVRISRLRQKIEQDTKDPKLIKTVYGAGYIFATQVTWSDKSE